MKNSIVAVSLTLGLLQFTAIVEAATEVATTPTDFICRPTQEPPVQLQISSNMCGGTRQQTGTICQEKIECAYFPPKATKSIEDAYMKINVGTRVPFESIDNKAFLGQSMATFGIEYLPTTVTCAAVTPNPKTGASCPTPRECKGDIFYNPKPAQIEYAGAAERINNALRGASSAGGTPTNPVGATQ
jgi:hypothetical protein